MSTAPSPIIEVRRSRAVRGRQRVEWRPLLLSLPAIAILLIMVVYPTIFAIWTALHQYNPMLPEMDRFVGLGNFEHAFNDPLFRDTVVRTAVFIIVAVTAELVLGFGLAIVVFYLIRRGSSLVRLALTMPMIMPPIAIGLVWRWLFDGQFGLINYAMHLLGLPPQIWLGNTVTAMGAVILVEVWQWMPFVFLCLYAGLASLPSDPIEAARVDGAGPMQLLWFVVFPMMKPIILVVLLFRIIDCMRVFDIIFVLTEGGPANGTVVYPFFVYMQGFRYYNVGYAAALSWLIVIVVSVLAGTLIRLMLRSSVRTAQAGGAA
jgi:multiple sugar transport system permease protein